MHRITLRGVLLWPLLPTLVVSVVAVALSPNRQLDPHVGPWLVLFYELGVVLWALWRAHRLGVSLIDQYRPRELRTWLPLAGWAMLAYLLLIMGGEPLWSAAWEALRTHLGLPEPVVSSGPATWADLPYFVLAAVVMAPVVEELLLRGLTLRVLGRWWGLVPGLLGQALIFGFLHDQGMIWKVVLGLFLGILALRSRSLFPNWLAHLGINAVATVFVVVGLAQPQAESAAESADALPVQLVLLALGVWASVQFLRRTRSTWQPRRRSRTERRLLWSLVRQTSRRPWPRGARPPRRFLAGLWEPVGLGVSGAQGGPSVRTD